MKIPHAFIVLAATAAGTVLAVDSAVIARIGGEDIKSTEVAPYFEALTQQEKEQLAGDPAALNQVVRSLIVEQLVLKQALANKWDKQPDVEAQLERLRQSALAESYLRSVSEPPTDFPGADDVAAAYEAVKSQLRVPKQFRLAQIYIAKGDDAKNRLEAVQKALKEPGVDFAAVARRESQESQSAANGGEIGWLAAAQLQPAIREKIVELGKDAVTAPIELADGWHIVKVLDIRDERTPALDEVRDAIAARLRQEQASANRSAYLERLLQENSVAINEIALGQLVETSKN